MTQSRITVDKIPLPTRKVSPEEAEAFRQALVGLFDNYAPDDNIAALMGSTYSADRCREKAEYLACQHDPQRATYWACDTGVPNDEILAVYTLLFL